MEGYIKDSNRVVNASEKEEEENIINYKGLIPLNTYMVLFVSFKNLLISIVLSFSA